MAQPKPRPWREVLSVHPAAELFPPISAAELKTLADKIRDHGVLWPLWFTRGFGSTKPPQLVDGRGRLDALELLGLPTYNADGRPLESAYPVKWIEGEDPHLIAIALNFERRHLTQKQKRKVIADLAKARPDLSDRTIAKQTGSSHHTVKAVRKKAEARGQIAHVSTRKTDSKGRQQPAVKAGAGG
jgi:hypothetical protein